MPERDDITSVSRLSSAADFGLAVICNSSCALVAFAPDSSPAILFDLPWPVLTYAVERPLLPGPPNPCAIVLDRPPFVPALVAILGHAVGSGHLPLVCLLAIRLWILSPLLLVAIASSSFALAGAMCLPSVIAHPAPDAITGYDYHLLPQVCRHDTNTTTKSDLSTLGCSFCLPFFLARVAVPLRTLRLLSRLMLLPFLTLGRVFPLPFLTLGRDLPHLFLGRASLLPPQFLLLVVVPFRSSRLLMRMLVEKILFFQRLGYQTDVPLEILHQVADGVPEWSGACPPVCGHCSVPDPAATSDPDATFNPDANPDATSNPGAAPVAIYNPDADPLAVLQATTSASPLAPTPAPPPVPPPPSSPPPPCCSLHSNASVGIVGSLPSFFLCPRLAVGEGVNAIATATQGVKITSNSLCPSHVSIGCGSLPAMCLVVPWFHVLSPQTVLPCLAWIMGGLHCRSRGGFHFLSHLSPREQLNCDGWGPSSLSHTRLAVSLLARLCLKVSVLSTQQTFLHVALSHVRVQRVSILELGEGVSAQIVV